MNYDKRTGLLESSSLWQIAIVIGFQAVILTLDIYTPSGSADSIFYFLPVALAALSRDPRIPLYAAASATVFLAIGFIYSPLGASTFISVFNRVAGTFVLWCIALLVRQIIVSRNRTGQLTWLKTAQSELALQIRGELSAEEISDRTLSFLAERLGAQVGVLYTRGDNGSGLARTASYAFDGRRSQALESYRLGEGLVGQAAAQNKPFVIGAVPAGYLNVSSGLGNGPVRQIVVAPLSAEDEVNGVVELGFLTDAPQQTLDLLADAGELAGVAIRSAQYKRRLAELLAESQQQAEELQTQQEEMSVLNEELEQQNRALKESQVRLENQQAELEQTNQQLEEQALSLERQRNALLEAQQRLKEQSDELARASRYKSEFLANMSHELRTPLNSALILAKLLAENRPGNLNEEQVKFAETIYTSGNDLLTLINDVLDLSKVEAGKLEVLPEPFELAHLLSSLERTFQPLAREKGLSFQVVVDPNVPEEITSDRQRLEQVLKNFLSNAFKFTDKGHIALRAHAEGEQLKLAVEDTGIGIANDQQQAVFEAFHQGDGTASRKYGGTGLGLSISRDLAQLLGGEIQVESEPGRGSTFTLLLPLTAPVAAPAPEAAATTAEAAEPMNRPAPAAAAPVAFSFTDDRAALEDDGRRILIVEDDEAFAKILLDLAHEKGFQALVAATAAEALELVEAHAPSAVLLDMRLPDHSGLVLLEQLKSDPNTRHIPVHMVSVEDFSTTARRLGAVGYMVKPVRHDQLVQAFENLEKRMEQKLKRVLVVEDDPVQRESIVQLIADKNVRIDSVASAEEALERLSGEVYDCMVMDLRLPAMSGYELLSELSKADSPYSYPPVIVYTGRDLSRAEEEKLRRYSSSIIVKGARSPERLLNEVTLFLHRVETELPPERQKMLRELRGREQVLEGARILVVDDDARNIFALSSVLEPHGAIVDIARNGREALAKLDAHPNTDLVLMDIMMPEMNGYEAMRAIREQERFQKLPIIAVTAKAMRDDQDNCLQAGANDSLAKPVELEKLLSLLRVWLSSRRNF
jgi:signal transduction histidine kinase/CheY-like chemotaxis protein